MSGHIRRRSAGSFELRYLVDGRVHTKTVRCTKKEAEKQLRELLGAADRRMHVAASKLTVAEHVRDRIAQWQAGGKITTRSAEQYAVLALRIERDLGAIELQRLTTMDVERWHTGMLARGLATRTARVAHGLLVAALRDGVRHNLIPRNAAADQGPPAREPPARATCPNTEQIEALEARLAEDTYWYPRLIVALYCGLRRGELLALRWANVDLVKGRLHVDAALEETKARGVSFKAPKSSAGRRSLTLPNVVVDTLKAHRRRQLERALLLGLGKPADSTLVFPGKGRSAASAAPVHDGLGARGGPPRDARAELACVEAWACQPADRGRGADHHRRDQARARRPWHHVARLCTFVRCGRQRRGGRDQSRASRARPVASQ